MIIKEHIFSCFQNVGKGTNILSDKESDQLYACLLLFLFTNVSFFIRRILSFCFWIEKPSESKYLWIWLMDLFQSTTVLSCLECEDHIEDFLPIIKSMLNDLRLVTNICRKWTYYETVPEGKRWLHLAYLFPIHRSCWRMKTMSIIPLNNEISFYFDVYPLIIGCLLKSPLSRYVITNSGLVPENTRTPIYVRLPPCFETKLIGIFF